MRLIFIVVLFWWLAAVPSLSSDPPAPPCLMQPPVLSMELPDAGFAWLPGGDSSGSCEAVPSEGWAQGKSGELDLFVHAEGPQGSGRFWTVTVGVSSGHLLRPARGICLSASTLGWRILQRYSKGPLPWLDDCDGDGSAEFLLWASFPLHDGASMGEYAMTAWVYRLVSEDSLSIDWGMSRTLARSLAREYRSPLDERTEYPGGLRTKAAEALESFANEQCRPGGFDAP